MIRSLALILATGLLAACGGGGGGNSSQPPSSLSYPAGTQALTVGTAINPITPTITGTVSGFTASPQLPAGLSLDSAKGVISGTPTTIAAAVNYTISASVSGGGTVSAAVSIAVNDLAPSNISYGTASVAYSATVESSKLTPTSAGGSVVGWSINPALPAGLTFSTADGSISGTPSAPAPAATYAVTAQNSGGQSTVPIKIAVGPGPVIDLGHQTDVNLVRASATRLLTQDQGLHWILWDYTGATIIARGAGGVPTCPSNDPCTRSGGIDMAGSSFVVVTPTGLQVRALSDGHILADITARVMWWKLATDGTYVTVGNKTALTAWTPTGQLLFSIPGDYTKAVTFATPGAILVAMSPVGQNVVQTIAVPSGTTSTGASFNGTFSSWFTDGSAFITSAGTTALIYSNNSMQQGSIAGVPANSTVGGRGGWVWTYVPSALNLYPATGSNPAAAVTFRVTGTATIYPSGNTIGVVDINNAMSVIDLSASIPTKTDYTVPLSLQVGYQQYEQPYAAIAASQWVMGNQSGVLLDGASLNGTVRYFGYGRALSIAGGTNYFAVATASGSILYFDSNTLALVGKINFVADKIALSTDGAVLAAKGYGAQPGVWLVNLYALPAGDLQYSWSYSRTAGGAGVIPADIALSGSGSVLAQDLSGFPSYTQEVSSPMGGAPIFSTTFNTPSVVNPPPALSLSPDGTLAVTSNLGGADNLLPGSELVGSNLWHNSTLVTAVSGLPAGWLDNTRLLINNYTFHNGSGWVYSGCTLYGPTGAATGGPCALKQEMRQIQPVGSDLIYTPLINQIFSVSAGTTRWVTGSTYIPGYTVGAVAGSNVVFVSGTTILAQPY